MSKKEPRSKEKKSNRFMGYLKVFLDDASVASVTPSSKYIVAKVIKAMNLGGARVVVEYGAAQGVITRRILEKMPADGRLVAIEFNKDLYEALCESLKDPRLIPVNGDVREIDAILSRYGIKEVDAITSGVPFSFFTPEQRRTLLKKTASLLRPGGRFVPYQVTTHLIPLLKDYFKSVDTQFEVRNIPPHFVFTATK